MTIPRWRVHFQNINPRDGKPGTGSLRIGEVSIGESSGTGRWDGSVTTIASALEGSPVSTAWQDVPLEAGREYLLGFSWTSEAHPRQVFGGGWITTHATSPDARIAPTQVHPLDLWIEAEVPATTTIFAVLGDSLASGVAATVPVRDSWPSIHGRRTGALPIHLTASGDTMDGWSDPTSFKWARWQGLTRADYAIHAMGFNDIGSLAPIWEMQARHHRTMEILRSRVDGPILRASLTPARRDTEEFRRIRRSYNTWLRGLDDRMIPFDRAVSSDDIRLAPDVDVDGTHMNTLGYSRMAAIVPAPVERASALPRQLLAEQDRRILAREHPMPAHAGLDLQA
ncbi:SGNH/GDSL hydrolase family protein [Brachybacterium sp. DNPG3]